VTDRVRVMSGLRIAACKSFTRREQTELIRIFELQRNEVLMAGHEHFSDIHPR